MADPIIGTIDFGDYPDNFWPYRDVISAVYQPGMTEAETLEEVKRWIARKLVPYLRANFQSLELSWEVQVNELTTSTRTMVSDAISAMTQQDFVNFALSQINSKNAVTGWYHVDNYGAKGDGTTLDHAAIQKAIDAANADYVLSGIIQKVYFSPKVYAVGVVDYHRADGTTYGITSLMLKDGVELYGPGTIKSADGGYGQGALYSMVRSIDTGVSNAGIRGLKFDGNKANHTASVQAGGILLEALANVWVLECEVANANGNAIMVRGSTSRLATNIRIEDNRVTSPSAIGIQSSQFDGLMILNNVVSNAANNGIDIYGEDGSVNTHAYNFTISNNRVKNCANGIFLETVSQGIATANRIQNSAGGEGFHVNRINGQPNRILISDNHVQGGTAGVGCTGDTGGVTIRNNEFEGFNVGGVVMGGAGNLSNYFILNNTMNGNFDTTPKVLIKAGTNQVVSIIHRSTITMSRNRAYDTVNMGPAAVTSTWTPAISPGDTITTQ